MPVRVGDEPDSSSSCEWKGKLDEGKDSRQPGTHDDAIGEEIGSLELQRRGGGVSARTQSSRFLCGFAQ